MTKLIVDIRNFASLRTNLKIESFLVATCHQDALNVAPHFFYRTGKAPVQTLIRIPKAVNLDRLSCFLDPSRQRWNSGFHHTACTFLSVYHYLTARPQNAKMFVADERVSLNKPEIKRTKWWNTRSSGISGGWNKCCNQIKCYMMHKSGQWLYKAYEWILFVYSYRTVSRGMGGPWNVIYIYAKTDVRWATYSRANRSQNRIHLKTWTARHERSYPMVRTDKTAHLIIYKMGEIKVLTLYKMRSNDRNLRTYSGTSNSANTASKISIWRHTNWQTRGT